MAPIIPLRVDATRLGLYHSCLDSSSLYNDQMCRVSQIVRVGALSRTIPRPSTASMGVRNRDAVIDFQITGVGNN